MEELIDRAKNGDEIAFEKIIEEVESDLYKIAKARISNEADIEDAFQETLIEVYKSIKKLKDYEKLRKWIIKIFINKCNRIYRRKYKKDISMDEYDMDNYLSTNDYKNVEDNMSFYNLLKDLKYEERIVIILFYMENYSVKEIKQILNMKENTIRTHLLRAKQKIKLNYGEEIKNYG